LLEAVQPLHARKSLDESLDKNINNNISNNNNNNDKNNNNNENYYNNINNNENNNSTTIISFQTELKEINKNNQEQKKQSIQLIDDNKILIKTLLKEFEDEMSVEQAGDFI
jgi:hypothetical protein